MINPVCLGRTSGQLLRSGLQIRAFFGNDRPFHGADLQANSTINAGRKINPVPVCSLGIFARTGVDAGNRAGIHAISDPFTGVGDNSMWHSNPLRNDLQTLGGAIANAPPTKSGSILKTLLHYHWLTASVTVSPVALTQAIWEMRRSRA